MNRDRDRFAEAGAPLTVIGQGTPEDGARFREDFGLELDLLVDTDRLAYEAAGTKIANLGELFGPKIVARGVGAALRSRVIQGKPIGSPTQLGGLLLITPASEVPWSHLSADASDIPPDDEVLEAIRTAMARAGGRPTA